MCLINNVSKKIINLMSQNNKNQENITFENAMTELEQIVKKTEEGCYNLEESIAQYKKAVQLKLYCQELLEKAKMEINIIQEENTNK